MLQKINKETTTASTDLTNLYSDWMRNQKKYSNSKRREPLTIKRKC